jgi:DNA-directed RNA polymerase subunit RPC12/RpoP
MAKFPAPDDPDCRHRSHYECVSCRKIVCARCGVEMAEASQQWKMIGYRCPDCLRRAKE